MKEMKELRKALIIPDCHRPFHHKRAYDLMLKVALDAHISEIVLLGDYADFYSVSRHLKDPRIFSMLEKEVLSVNEGLDQLDKLWPDLKKVYLEGNHEARLEKYLFERAPALFGLTECRSVFRLSQRPNWQYIPFGKDQAYRVLNSQLVARHRPLATNPKAGLQRAHMSYCYGDIHKIEEAHFVGLDQKSLVAFSPGWLGDQRLDAFSYMLSPPQWQLGFALVFWIHRRTFTIRSSR